MKCWPRRVGLERKLCGVILSEERSDESKDPLLLLKTCPMLARVTMGPAAIARNLRNHGAIFRLHKKALTHTTNPPVPTQIYRRRSNGL
jgi:hypothetical protein